MKAYVMVGISKRLLNKHFVKIGGKRMIDMVIDNLRDIGLEVIVYSKIYFETEVELIRDGGEWILPSFTNIIDMIQDRAFIFGGDMPLIKREAVEMIKGYRGESVIPRWETGYMEPLHGLYHKDFDVDKKAKSLHEAIKNGDAEFIPAEILPTETFFNINTREDLMWFRNYYNLKQKRIGDHHLL